MSPAGSAPSRGTTGTAGYAADSCGLKWVLAMLDLFTIPRSELALQEIDSKTFRAISQWRWVMEAVLAALPEQPDTREAELLEGKRG